MTFQNLPLALEQLPSSADLSLEPMAPNYPREVLTQNLITWSIIVVVCFAPFIFVAKPEALRLRLLLLPIIMVALASLSTTVSWFAAKAKGMALREHDVSYRSGLIWQKTITLAYDRIQHIEISSGPLQRKFGLASLKFFTAGGHSVDMKIDGLRREHAEQLRQQILTRAERDRSRAFSEHDTTQPDDQR